MIKARKKSKAISLFVFVLAVVLFSSFIVVNAQQNGNISDTPYYYQGNATSTKTPPRDKQDYTSCYAYNYPTTNMQIDQVNPYGCVVYSGVVVDEQDCTYGATWSLPVGTSRCFMNTVKEDGLYYCRLRLGFNNTNYKDIHIEWSPDSINCP